MNERDIFLAAIEIADLEKRATYVEQACGTDSALRAQVEELLRSHEQTSQFLETPAAAADPAIDQTVLTDSADCNVGPQQAGLVADTDFCRYLEPSTRPGWLGRLGHYEIEAIIGRGAFGIVAKAFDEKLHRVVAIKMLSPELAVTSPPRKRFLREARTAAAVRHENIVGIYAVEEEPVPWLVMEFVPGETLQQRLDGNGPLEVSDVLRISQQVAAGLAAAHGVNLIHRDIKPSNIMLDGGPSDRAQISDFGLARAVDDATMTSSGLIAGTPMYMAPEQARGEVLDHRADLFSLGTVMYQMVCGRPPFRAANTVAVLKRVCEDTPRPIEDVISGTPDWLSTIIFRLLEKERDDRFQTAQEVADLLARCQNELQLNGRVTCVKGAFDNSETVIRAPHTSTRPSPRKKSKGLFAAGLLGLITLIAVFVVNNNRRADDRDPATEVTEVSNAATQPAVEARDDYGLKFDGVDDYVEWRNVPFPQGNAFKVELSATLDVMPPNDGTRKTLFNWGQALMIHFYQSQSGELRLAVSSAAEPESNGRNIIHSWSPPPTLSVGEQFDLVVEYQAGRLGLIVNGKQLPRSEVIYAKLVDSQTVSEVEPEFFQPVARYPHCYLGINTSQVPARTGWAFPGTVHSLRLSQGDDETIAEFDFSRDSGTTLHDQSGNGFDGTIVGVKWLKAGESIAEPTASSPANFALQFDGVDDGVEIPSLACPARQPLTIECYVLPRTIDGSGRLIMMGGDASAGLFIGESHWTTNAFQSGHPHGVTSPIAGPIHRPIHLASVWDCAELRLYVDGKRSGLPYQSSARAIPTANYTQIAGPPAPGVVSNLPWFDGILDEIRISSVARYSADFSPATRLKTDSQTLAIYHFDEGQGDVLKDSSGNGHHGKIIGAKWIRAVDF